MFESPFWVVDLLKFIINQSEIIYPTCYQLHNSKKTILPRPLGALTLSIRLLCCHSAKVPWSEKLSNSNFIKTQWFALIEVALDLCNWGLSNEHENSLWSGPKCENTVSSSQIQKVTHLQLVSLMELNWIRCIKYIK